MSGDLYHREYPIDMTPREAASEIIDKAARFEKHHRDFAEKVNKLTEKMRLFSCCGKQVMIDGNHFANAYNEAAAFHIAMALNVLERSLPEPSQYNDTPSHS